MMNPVRRGFVAMISKEPSHGDVEDDEKPKKFEMPEDDGPGDYSPDKDAKLKAARAVRMALDNSSDEALADALTAFYEACG